MFEAIEKAPPDAILGLTETFKKDPNPNKINLSVGVYKDAEGNTPVLRCVKEAERALLEYELTKSYLPMSGSPIYADCVQQMMLGEHHPIVTGKRAATSHTPGGTGALRLVGDYLKTVHPDASIWLSSPTWANHAGIFGAAGVSVQEYDYFDTSGNSLDIDRMLSSLQAVPDGDAVLLHACCHNPTGVDPTAEQWQRIAGVLASKRVLPVIDFAYQGFGDGLEDDAMGLRILTDQVKELLVCSSFSKNFSLYCERVGAMTVISDSPDKTEAVQSHVKLCIRRNFSNPPAHGGSIVSTVLNDQELHQMWLEELKQMRDRINGIRQLLAESLNRRGVNLSPEGNAFITRQRGMFSFSGLNKEQVQRLRDRYSIYIVGSGRINVAGITEKNIDRLCDAIAEVTA